VLRGTALPHEIFAAGFVRMADPNHNNSSTVPGKNLSRDGPTNALD
jgi:hypothetical protein